MSEIEIGSVFSAVLTPDQWAAVMRPEVVRQPPLKVKEAAEEEAERKCQWLAGWLAVISGCQSLFLSVEAVRLQIKTLHEHIQVFTFNPNTSPDCACASTLG